jgi:hypothetical protein
MGDPFEPQGTRKHRPREQIQLGPSIVDSDSLNRTRLGSVYACTIHVALPDAVGKTCHMPLHGKYVPSPAQWVRDQVEKIERSGGDRGHDFARRAGDSADDQGARTVVTGDEKDLWWERAVAVWPDYATYQQKATREIPVFVLEPA